MNETFNIKEFIKNLADDLFVVFDRSSKQGTHPEEIGRAKEIKLAKQIGSVFPSSIGIGRGKVIDCFGNTSAQCDMVIYEKNLIPTFVADENDDYTYFPCEGVIAVGEIKSTLNIDEFTNSIKKLEKIKELRRSIVNLVAWRKCLSTTLIDKKQPEEFGISNPERYDPVNNIFDSIYTFIFSKRDVIAEETIQKILIDAYKESMHLCPNAIYSFNKPIHRKTFSIIPENGGAQINFISKNFNSIVSSKTNEPFSHLVYDILSFIEYARTQPFNYSNYYDFGFNDEAQISKVQLFSGEAIDFKSWYKK